MLGINETKISPDSSIFYPDPIYIYGQSGETRKGRMDIPPYLVENIAFLEIYQKGVYDQIGTGFFVHHMEGDYPFMYMVTCRHVIEPALKRGLQLFLRVNHADGKGVGHVPLETLDDNWVYANDENEGIIDLAVLIFEPVKLPKSDQVKTGSLNISQLSAWRDIPKKKKRNLGVGDEIYFFGLFKTLVGNQRNLPIARFGKISLIPDEKIPGIDLDYGVSDYILVECQAYPGMSGALVYLYYEFGEERVHIPIGVIVGYHYDDELLDRKFTHYGISKIIPIEKLEKILFGEHIVNDRKAKLKNHQMKGLSAPATSIRGEDYFSRDDMEAALRKAFKPESEDETSDEGKSKTSE